jgi:nicotinamide-nucleotide amidase
MDSQKDQTQEPIEIVLGKLLLDRKMTMATAESCTGGSIAARVTSVPGSSEYFKGGVVAYTIAVKESVLHVPAEIIDKYGVVSEETAVEMAKGAMRTIGADCAVATTGVAGPSGGTPEIPVGSVWIAAAVGHRIITKLQKGDDGRMENVNKAVRNALHMLCELLEEDASANRK